MPYIETSAKSDYNVDDAFLTIAKMVKERLAKIGGGGPAPAKRQDNVVIGQGQSKGEKKGCCK